MLKLPEGFEVPMVNPVAFQTCQEDSPILVHHVTATFLEFAKVRYVKQANELARVRLAYQDIENHDGGILASQYGPRALQQQRQRWVETENKSRDYVNRLVNLVKRMFKHAVSQELVPESVWTRLCSIEPLREGHTEAYEPEPVLPVAIDHVRATAKHLSPVLKARLRIHVATGMRPSELCRMRPCDIDRTGSEWVCRPPKHKTAHKKKPRVVPPGWRCTGSDHGLTTAGQTSSWRRGWRRFFQNLRYLR